MNRSLIFLKSASYYIRQFFFATLLLLLNSASYGQVDVIMNHNDLKRTGWNSKETILTTKNVSSGNFGKIFSREVDDQIYAQPLVLSNFHIAGGIHNIVRGATGRKRGDAGDADDASGSKAYWQLNLTFDSTNYRPVNRADMN